VSRSAGAVRPTVLLVVEQLRRRVPGGIGTYAHGLLSGLAALERERGLSVATVTLYASWAYADPLADWGRPLRRVALPSRLLTRAWETGYLLAPRGYEVVHGVSLSTPGLRRASRSSLAVTVHDLAWRRFPEAATARGRRWHEAALERMLELAKAFVVPSADVRDDLVAAGAPPSAVTVIPEGADHLAPPDADAARRLLRAAGVAGPYLLSVSTLEPRKNLVRLVEGYARARAGGLGAVPLVVVGPRGWGRPGLGRVPEGVSVLGPVPAPVLSALYADATAFVYVPLAEGYGLPPLEAMAAGTAVVASTAVPSVRDDGGGSAAVLVDPEDPDAIAEGLVRVVHDPVLAASAAERGAAVARARTWRAAAARHLELWARLS